MFFCFFSTKQKTVPPLPVMVLPQRKAAERYVILYPAPRAASLATTSHLILLGNGDELFDGIKICGLKYFIENVLSVDGTEPVRGNVAQNNF